MFRRAIGRGIELTVDVRLVPRSIHRLDARAESGLVTDGISCTGGVSILATPTERGRRSLIGSGRDTAGNNVAGVG
jgi:hypothetical protein